MDLDLSSWFYLPQGILRLSKKPFVRSYEFRALSLAPSKSEASCCKSQLHTVLGWFEFLLVYFVDDHRNFLDVFLSTNISQCVARHSVVAHIGDVWIDGQKYASLGSALDGVDGVLAYGPRFLSWCL